MPEMIKIPLGRHRNLIIMPALVNWQLSCALGLIQIGPFLYEYPSKTDTETSGLDLAGSE